MKTATLLVITLPKVGPKKQIQCLPVLTVNRMFLKDMC